MEMARVQQKNEGWHSNGNKINPKNQTRDLEREVRDFDWGRRDLPLGASLWFPGILGIPDR